MDDLNGKVAVITGGGSGIGRALAHAFAGHGMKVVLADVNEVSMRAVEAELAEGGTEVLPVVCDTSLEAEVHALAQATLAPIPPMGTRVVELSSVFPDFARRLASGRPLVVDVVAENLSAPLTAEWHKQGDFHFRHI